MLGLIIGIVISLPTSQMGGIGLDSIPVNYDFHTFNTNNITITIPGEEVNIEAYENTYAHLTATFDKRVSWMNAYLLVRSGSIGSIWGPGIGISWDENNSLTFVIGNITQSQQKIII